MYFKVNDGQKNVSVSVECNVELSLGKSYSGHVSVASSETLILPIVLQLKCIPSLQHRSDQTLKSAN